PRCPYAQDNCRRQRPTLDPQAHSQVRCFYPLNQEVA
ncbi:dipeptide ABC transporter ATP-binding protein DppD, partial [Pseudomonas putida]|nr:dipeptide ABC transporter ATP-binding protein DppD [Pseudomonas putida]